MHFRDFGCIYSLLNIYLIHFYTYTYFRARKNSVIFDIKDTAAASSFGGPLHVRGKTGKSCRGLNSGCFIVWYIPAMA